MRLIDLLWIVASGRTLAAPCSAAGIDQRDQLKKPGESPGFVITTEDPAGDRLGLRVDLEGDSHRVHAFDPARLATCSHP